MAPPPPIERRLSLLNSQAKFGHFMAYILVAQNKHKHPLLYSVLLIVFICEERLKVLLYKNMCINIYIIAKCKYYADNFLSFRFG